MGTTGEALRAELERTITGICEAVGGVGCVLALGYDRLQGRNYDQHQFFVVIATPVKGALVGKDGANAQRLRELVRTRATVLGNQDPIDVRVIGSESDAPEGVFGDRPVQQRRPRRRLVSGG